MVAVAETFCTVMGADRSLSRPENVSMAVSAMVWTPLPSGGSGELQAASGVALSQVAASRATGLLST